MVASLQLEAYKGGVERISTTVGSKIIRALEIVRVKKFIFNAVLSNKYLSSHDL